MPEKNKLSDAEEVELEFKRLQVDELRERIRERDARRESAQDLRNRQILDFKKSEQERLRRQRICKHRKGGRDNRFANGNDQNYSVITNTYPCGEICIMCTRCGKEVWRPERALKKADPKLYEQRMEEFRTWANFPTDNTPSGSKIFEITAA